MTKQNSFESRVGLQKFEHSIHELQEFVNNLKGVQHVYPNRLPQQIKALLETIESCVSATCIHWDAINETPDFKDRQDVLDGMAITVSKLVGVSILLKSIMESNEQSEN